MLSTLRIRLGVVALLVTGLLAGCGTSGTGGTTQAGPTSRPSLTQGVGELHSGFVDPASPPPPEGTIHPAPGSWDDVHPKPGYRVALVVDGVRSRWSAQTQVLRRAVVAWTSEVHADLRIFTPRRPQAYVAAIQDAIDTRPNLVLSVGNGLVDPIAMVSAPNLETEFLVLGAQIAEPTSNVTAADWHGAMFRGEGLGLPESYDPASFTADRAGRALRAGVAAVLEGYTGIVVEVD